MGRSAYHPRVFWQRPIAAGPHTRCRGYQEANVSYSRRARRNLSALPRSASSNVWSPSQCDLTGIVSQWMFGPMGPVLVTPDELDDPDDLAIECRLNGEQVQHARTSDMIFPVAEIIARLSAVTPLLPGDVIFTGTPAGVGVGRTPPRFIQPGDEVETSISGIGSIRQRFVEAR